MVKEKTVEMNPRQLYLICKDIYKGIIEDMSLQEKIITIFRPLYAPLHILLNKIPRGSRLLDIGCGTGVFLILANFLRGIESGLGVDINRRSIELAESVADSKKLSFRVISNLSDLQNVDCTYLSCIDLLHHIGKNEKVDLIKKISDLLPIGGKVLLKDLAPKPRWRSIANRITDYLSTRSKVAYLSQYAAAEMLEKNGFEITDSGKFNMYIWSHYFIEAKKLS